MLQKSSIKRNKLIIITGPTASGKTALAIKLAKKFQGEIISADSRQVYRGMDIGTAKPPISYPRRRRGFTKSSVPSQDGTPVIAAGIPHHLIDIRNPSQSYTLAHFKRDALKAIKQIQKRGHIPFLVGGTALYIWAITDNLEIPEVKPNKKLRKRLEKQLVRRGVNYLYNKLIEKDPEAAYIIDPRNPRRIIRALEVMAATKKPFSATRKQGKKLFDFLMLAPRVKPKNLKAKIVKRTHNMLKTGLVREVQNLTKKYDRHSLSSLDAIGYREVIDYLAGDITLKEAERQINANSWHFAQRQMTWFKKLPIRWIGSKSQAERLISQFLLK